MLNIDIATKYYENTIGIEKVSLKVGPGEIVGLLGDNGSGKTTLLKAAMNFIKLNIGDVTINQKLIKDDVYKQISYISSEGSYFALLNIKEHEDFYSTMVDNFQVDKFREYIDFFKLPLDKKIASFSKGQKAKLEISIGLSKNANYILIDEPFEGKDIFTRKDFIKLMIAKLEEHQSIIVATHMIEDIEKFLTRVVILDNGRKICDISTEFLEENNITLYDYLKKIKNYDEEKTFLTTP